MSRRAHCAARAAGTGRACRAFGCWHTPGVVELYCKRHAQEIAIFTDDPRIMHVTTGRIETATDRAFRCRPRVGPAPEGVDAIVVELRTIRCRRDWLRCRRAIFADLPTVIDYARDRQGLVYAAALKPDIAGALYDARRRLELIGAAS